MRAIVPYRTEFMRGLNNEADARNVTPQHAADLDNVIIRDGHVTHRPALEMADQALEDIANSTVSRWIFGLLYVGQDVDYVVATGYDDLAESRVYVLRYDDDYQLSGWSNATLERYRTDRNAWSLFEYLGDVYLSGSETNFVIRGSYLGRVDPEQCGMSALDLDQVTDAGNDHFDKGGNGAGEMWGEIQFWVSRYNHVLDLESNAVRLWCDGTNKQLLSDSVTAKQFTITFDNIGHEGRIGCATHYRIYQTREDGQPAPGLIAEVEVDEENDSTFSYTVGATGAEENNGEATYAEGSDDTSYEYAPPSMNHIPPAATDFGFWDGRMFYGTSQGFVYFSQNVEELQGHVEGVGEFSFRKVPNNDRVVGMRVFNDFLYIWGRKKIYRMSGSVNSLTNRGAALGQLEDDIDSTDVVDNVENSVGSVSSHAIIEVETASGSRIFFPGPNNIYSFDGTNTIPLTATKVQKEYLDRLADVERDQIHASHYARLNLVVFSFFRRGIMAYDYIRREWVKWDNFGAKTTLVDNLGACCTRSVHSEDPDIPLILAPVDNDEADDHLKTFTEESDPDTDVHIIKDAGYDASGNAWTKAYGAHWMGPELELQAPARRKRGDYLKGMFKFSTGGQVQVYCFRNGFTAVVAAPEELGTQFPQTPEDWDQDELADTYPTVRLGIRAQAIQPRFDLDDSGYRSVLLGYALEGSQSGRR